MMIADALALVLAEMDRARQKFAGWPRDPVHAAAIVVEEAGELMQACLNYTYETGGVEGDDAASMRAEAVQTAAMAIEFLVNEVHYRPRPSPQRSKMSDPLNPEKH